MGLSEDTAAALDPIDLRPTIPTASQVLLPVVQALRARDGSATNAEITKHVVDHFVLSEAQQQVLRSDGRRPQIDQAISEAKTLLKTAGLLSKSVRNVWALTEAGELATDETIDEAPRVAWGIYRDRRSANGLPETDELIVEDEEDVAVRSWKQVLIDRMLQLDPSAFERLAQRILREAGFESVKVRGRSGDGGIDGEGVYRPLPLIGFQVYWQSKRYTGTVAAEDIRNFRGAMVGRGDKGLFLTTGTFTGPARDEASREGAPPIDLIDGEGLADLLASLKLGVRVTERIEKDYEIQLDWFDNL